VKLNKGDYNSNANKINENIRVKENKLMKTIKYARIQEKLIDLKQGKTVLLIIMYFFIKAVHFGGFDCCD